MLEHLLKQTTEIWQGQHYQGIEGLDTGFPALNKVLANHGWPANGIVELISLAGMGELRLLLPALRHIQQQRTLVWLACPWQPHAPQLINYGLDLSKHLYVQAAHKQQQWAAEQSLKNPACGALLFWPSQTLSFTAYRRLQILCHEQQKPCFIFMDKAPNNSPCALRLAIQSREQDRLQLEVLKSRGSWSNPNITVQITSPTPFTYPVQSLGKH
jgi:hypothetical protein